MIFNFRKWNVFCKSVSKINAFIEPACDVSASQDRFIVLKHDVETNIKKALKIATIEHKCGIRGSYYVQAYLLKKTKNIEMLKKIKDYGHEVSYHYDVLDSTKGNIELAVSEFEQNKSLFEENGFILKTVCQHGNPLIERNGYSSNRDFFRNKDVQNKYPDICDIMVNYKEKYSIEYSYYSDAGRKFKKIFDPLNNDIVDTSDKDLSYSNLDEVLRSFEGNVIISTHPHRWCSLSSVYILKSFFFKIAKFVAKTLYKIPLFRKFISKHYDLAKKI